MRSFKALQFYVTISDKATLEHSINPAKRHFDSAWREVKKRQFFQLRNNPLGIVYSSQVGPQYSGRDFLSNTKAESIHKPNNQHTL